MKSQVYQTYDAAIYVRLSKDDTNISQVSNKTESDSIANQKKFIIEFLSDKPDIHIVDTFTDDGYSGSDFNRPGFIQMFEQINKGKIKCVIVKDLSRLGRNYIETGRYVERIFPSLGVRFISINDHYDSINRNDLDSFIIPFHNLVNDAYLRDTSIKIRSHLDIKRKQGEYTGNFVTYGYRKKEENHNKIEIDECAAVVIKDIFDMKLRGMNQQKIADYLNNHGILSPMEYKVSKGIKINANFKLFSKAKWSPIAVSRILTNPIYIGVLEQGKTTTPNYKIKKRMQKSREEWICIDGNHPPIISKDIFETVARIMENDTRTPPYSKYLHTFSGMVKCGHCGENMIRKTTTAKGKEYAYYICAARKHDKKCGNTGISEKRLEKIVINALNKQISCFIDAEKLSYAIKNHDLRKACVEKHTVRMDELEKELEESRHIKSMLYKDFHDGIINQKEYGLLSVNYNTKIYEIQNAIGLHEEEISKIENNLDVSMQFFENLLINGSIKKLDRKTTILLIRKIIIYDKENIQIVFDFGDEILVVLENMLNHATKERCSLNGKM